MPDAAHALPDGAAGLAPHWLGAALILAGRLPPDSAVRFDATIIAADRGFTGEIARVRWRATAGDRAGRLIAKFPAASGSAFERCAREVRFYDELAAECGVSVPAVIFAAADPAAGRVVLLLEEIEGRHGDVVEGCTVVEAAELIVQTARMHGRWWCAPRLDELTWLPRWGQGEAGSPHPHRRRAERYRQRIEPFMEHFGATAAPGLAGTLDELAGEYEVLLARVARLPRTLIHGDLHLDNVVFTRTAEEGPGAVILDWQSVSAGPGAYDLARLIAESLHGPAREAVGDLVGLYHALLAESTGAVPLTRRQLDEQLHDMLRCVLAGMVSGYGGREPGSLTAREQRMLARLLTEDAMGGVLTR